MDPEMLKRLQAGLGGGGGMQPPPMPQGAPPMPQGMPQPGGMGAMSDMDHEAMRKAMMGAGAPQPPPGMQAPPMNLSAPPAPSGQLAGLFAPSMGGGKGAMPDMDMQMLQRLMAGQR